MPIDGRKLARSLVSKGFDADEKRDHVWYHHKLNGKVTGQHTKLSHSRGKMRDIRDELASLIRKQLSLDSKQQLEDLANCPMSGDDYVRHLRSKHLLS